jgi:Fe-S cluster assembly protein SufD
MSAVTTTKDITNEIIASFQTARFGEAKESREKAIRHLEKTGLPTQKHEEYRFAPVTKSIESNFTWKNEVSPSTLSSISEYLIPELDSNLLVFINGSFSKSLSKIISPESQIKVKTLYEAFQSDRAVVDQYFDKLINAEVDGYAALNTALWQEGVFIYVPENTVVEKPFLVLHIHDANQSQVIAHTRILAVVEKNSSLNLIENFDSRGSIRFFITISEYFGDKQNAQL